MTDERDFELLDDYLTNRLNDQDRSAFEQKLQSDPVLQNELTLQKRLVKGIRDARVAELKSMFNNIPVSATGPEKTLATKIAIGTALSFIIATAAYWYFNQDERQITQSDALPQEHNIDKGNVIENPQVETDTGISAVKPILQKDKNQTSAGTEHSKPSEAKKPAPLSAPQGKINQSGSDVKEPVLDVFDPAKEEGQNEATIKKENQAGLPPKTSSLVVETDTENRRYTFHYQFKDGKVFLYGPFQKNLYEIMEFFSDDKRTVFLFYKDNFYKLEERNNGVRPLTTISDPALIKKLKEYRNTK